MAIKLATGGSQTLIPPASTLNANRQLPEWDATSQSFKTIPAGAALSPTINPRPRRPSSHLATGIVSNARDSAALDSGVTGTAGQFTLDSTRQGLSSEGSVKLVAPGTPGGSNQVTIPFNATWNYGDGTTPTGYFRVWIAIQDDRSVLGSSAAYLRVYLGTAGGFTNCIYTDVGSAIAGDGSPTTIKSQLRMVPITMPMLDPSNATYYDTTATGGSRWVTQGTGFAAGDWAAVTQMQMKISGVAPTNGSGYVAPTAWFLGAEFVPLPPYAVFCWRQDWTQLGQMGFASYLSAQYGVTPTFALFPDPMRGTQVNPVMNTEQVLEVIRERGAEAALYVITDSTFPVSGPYPTPVSGDWGYIPSASNNGYNWDNGTGVQWTQFSRSQIENSIGEAQAWLASLNIAGHDILCGQERKMLNNESSRSSPPIGGEDLLAQYASVAHCPVGGAACGWWPADNPLRVPTYMIDATRDFAGTSGPSATLTANAKARLARAVVNRELFVMLSHALVNDQYPGASGLDRYQVDAYMAEVTKAGRFDGTSGKLMSHREAFALNKYST